MAMYIWQRDSWPELKWDSEALLQPLGAARKAQGELVGFSEFFSLESQVDVLVEEAVNTAAIEGEKLDRDAVRSSVARRLGLPTAGLPTPQRHVDGLVEMLVDATRNYQEQLTAERLKAWHAALFPSGYSGLSKIATGDWRESTEPMQVVSGPLGKEKVHYEAPPAEYIEAMIEDFLNWFTSSLGVVDGLVRAAVAHLWFVTIHPFDDGNGRIARTVADMALAQDEDSARRLYSISVQIEAERSTYYEVLEQTQKGSGDFTPWIIWFLGCLERAILRSEEMVRKALLKASMWQDLSRLDLNKRQKKVINRLFDAGPEGFEGGLTNRKYVGMTKTSKETAKRDIADLVYKGILIRNPGGGRSANYRLAWPK